MISFKNYINEMSLYEPTVHPEKPPFNINFGVSKLLIYNL
jgi:hypothetical protein